MGLYKGFIHKCLYKRFYIRGTLSRKTGSVIFLLRPRLCTEVPKEMAVDSLTLVNSVYLRLGH